MRARSARSLLPFALLVLFSACAIWIPRSGVDDDDEVRPSPSTSLFVTKRVVERMDDDVYTVEIRAENRGDTPLYDVVVRDDLDPRLTKWLGKETEVESIEDDRRKYLRYERRVRELKPGKAAVFHYAMSSQESAVHSELSYWLEKDPTNVQTVQGGPSPASGACSVRSAPCFFCSRRSRRSRLGH